MTKFTTETILGEVFTAPIFENYQEYLLFTNPKAERVDPSQNITKLPLAESVNIGWSPEGVVSGLNFFAEEIETDHVKQYFVYDADEITDSQQKHVNFIRLLPKQWNHSKPAIVLAAGGAYGSVCTMVEALPTARHFSEAGYQVFVFTYRIGEVGVTPKAIDDLARGIRFLKEHAEELELDPNRLVIGGFSAGANLISNWGVPALGYRKYNMPKPLAMLPVYTFIDLKAESTRDENGGILAPMFGPNFMDYLDEYNIVDHIDGDYPPCYLVCGKDDKTVSPRNSELFKQLLDRVGVPAVLNEGNHAAHGFGDGTGTDVEGWPEQAIEFIEGLEV